MANYDKETKYYWLQLKEDFFEEDSIDWLESQENGKEYALFYLKLCLKSLKTNGILVRNVGKMIVPYNNEKLAEVTKTKLDTVIVAMELLKGIGLIEVLDNGELYMTQIEGMIGTQSKGAFKKQQQRMIAKNKNVGLLEDKEETSGGQLSTKDRDRDRIRDRDRNKDKDIIISPVETGQHDDIPYQEIIEYLNMKTNSSYRASTNKTKTLIKARFNEGFTLNDFKIVIDNKCLDWLNNKDMCKYLRPETLFGNKFESYLNQKPKEITTKDIASNMNFSDF